MLNCGRRPSTVYLHIYPPETEPTIHKLLGQIGSIRHVGPPVQVGCRNVSQIRSTALPGAHGRGPPVESDPITFQY